MDSFITESKRIIRKASENNKLVIFVGAGVSANSGYPSWKSLVQEFAKGLGRDIKDISSEDYLKIPQYYYNSRKEKEYYDVIWNKFNVKVKPNEIHDGILALKPYHIVTTNYDELLEEAARNNGMFYDVVSKDTDLPYTLNNNMIIKMHGDLKNKNIVLKEDDYLAYFKNFNLIQNYIKSLIATYTILFVGYSISDIDVKYIFQWVKDILGNDFQQAYFLENNEDKKFDQVEFDYYKNRGINLLYYSQTDGIEYFKRPIEFQSLTDDRGKNTCAFLQYILDRDSRNKIDIEYAYDMLKNLNNLNKIFFENIKDALNLETPFKEQDGSVIYSHFSVEGENLELNTSIVTNLFLQVKQFDDKLKKFNECEDYKNREKLKKEIDFSKEIKVQLIKDVFCKAGIKKIFVKKSLHSYIEYDKNVESEGDVSLLLSSNIKDEIGELEKYTSEFDYSNLYKCLNNINIDDADGNEEKFLDKAYLLYKLGEYLESYKILKKLSEICFFNKKYYLYFISEFNRYHLGRIILNNNDINSKMCISDNMEKLIKLEIAKIDLDNIYLKLPSSNRPSLIFLRDILNFKFVYRKMKDTIKLKEKIKKNRNKVYVGIKANQGQIYKFRKYAKEVWKFLIRNRLMLDNCKEVQMFFYNYVENIIGNHMIKYKEKERAILDIDGKTIKLQEIDEFSLFIMLIYLDKKDIKYVFQKYEVRSMKLEEEALEFIENVYDNMINSILRQKNRLEVKQTLNKLLYILSRINIGKNFFVKLIDGFLKIIDNYGNKELEQLYKNLLSFIIGQNNNFKENICIEKLEEILNYMLDKITLNLDTHCFYKEHTSMEFIRKISIVMRNVDEGYEFQSDKRLKLLIKQMEVEVYGYILKYILIPLYKLANEEVASKISKLIFKNLRSIDKFDDECFSLYYEAVANNIIVSSIQLEEKAIKFINEHLNVEKSNANNEHYSFSNSNENPLSNIANLILNDLIIEPNRFKQFKNQDKKFSFLIDMDNYNYDDFQLEWILGFNDKLHEMISKSEKTKLYIKEKLKGYIIENKCDKRIKNIFFTYYD